MFGKKCSKCGNKISKSYDFCPFCGKNFKTKYDQDDYGLLGKNDFIEKPIMSLGDSFMDKLFNSAIRALEKQMKNLSHELAEPRHHNQRNPSNLNVQFSVNGQRIFPQRQEIRRQQEPRTISEEKIKRFAKLPKKEPESKMKRLSGRIIYELSVPGVKDIEDIFITQLESSIEIKALSDKQVYSKILNVKLPVLRYLLHDGNLIIELQGR